MSVRRKPGTLLPLETSILETGVALRNAAEDEFHGFGLAKGISERDGARRLTAHGTLYKAPHDAELTGAHPSATALRMASRVVRGAPADFSWRLDHRVARRAGPPPP